MKYFISGLTHTEALRLCNSCNVATGRVQGERGNPARGHQRHPHMPSAWDGTGRVPRGWVGPKAPYENPSRPGEWMVVIKDRQVDRVVDSREVSEDDTTDVVDRVALADTTKPADYIPVEPER